MLLLVLTLSSLLASVRRDDFTLQRRMRAYPAAVVDGVAAAAEPADNELY